jgi:hypothetical protein
MSEVDMTVEELHRILHPYGYKIGNSTAISNTESVHIFYTDKPHLFNLYMPETNVDVYSPRRILTDEEFLYLKLNENHLDLITLEELIHLAKTL